MLTKGQEYTDQGQDYYEKRYHQRALQNLNRRAQQLGMTPFQLSHRRCRLENVLKTQSLARSFLRGSTLRRGKNLPELCFKCTTRKRNLLVKIFGSIGPNV